MCRLSQTVFRHATNTVLTLWLLGFFCVGVTCSAWALGNVRLLSYQEARRILYAEIYADHRITLYCGFSYSTDRQPMLPEDFCLDVFHDRALRVETEHVVPVENFGRTFVEWREGHSECVDSLGRHFRGRKCVGRVNEEFRRMEADLYNLYPAVGSVNALRSNFNFQELGQDASLPFGPSCPVRMQGRRIEPPEKSRGTIARTYLYMEANYPRYRMSRQQRQLMHIWNRNYPPDAWECLRAKRIRRVQGNANSFVEDPCSTITLPAKEREK